MGMDSPAAHTGISTPTVTSKGLKESSPSHDTWTAKSVLPAVLGALGYYAGVRIGFLLTPGNSPISTFWPPNAVLLAVLLLTPFRSWWICVAAILPAHLVAQLPAGVPLTAALGWFISNVMEAVIGAICIRRFTNTKSLFESVRGLLIFVSLGVVFAPLVTSFLDAAVVVISGVGQHYWNLWTTRMLSNMLGELTLVPTIVLIANEGRSWMRRADRARYAEAGLLLIGLVAVTFLAFGSSANQLSSPALLYIPLPFLLWASLRFGMAGVSVCLLGFSLLSTWYALQGRGPFPSPSSPEDIISLQVFLIMIAGPLMLLAAVIAERQRAGKILQRFAGLLIDAHEQAHRQVARELHDDLGQQLAIVESELAEIARHSEHPVAPRLQDVQEKVATVSRATREISHGLHPSQLEHLGLAVSINKLCRDMNAGGKLTVRFSSHNFPEQIPSAVAVCLYRVVQESLRNVATHSRATTASIELRTQGERIVLRISDNGVGFIYGRQPSGLGLISMRERVRGVGGYTEITSSPGAGTKIEVNVPLLSNSTSQDTNDAA